MPTAMTTPSKVEQVDIDLAKRIIADAQLKLVCMKPEYDAVDNAAAWIASHRIAAEAKTREEDARIADDRRKAERAKGNFAQAHVCDDIATAIRSRMETDNER